VRLKDCADAVAIKVLELLLSPSRTTRALAVSTLVQLGEPVAAFADDVARVMEHADAGCAWLRVRVGLRLGLRLGSELSALVLCDGVRRVSQPL